LVQLNGIGSASEDRYGAVALMTVGLIRVLKVLFQGTQTSRRLEQKVHRNVELKAHLKSLCRLY
jgi:hypothetical protein